jgi:hypothetical protein
MGAGCILAGLAQLAPLPVIYRRIMELIYTNYDYIGLETVASGIITALLAGGIILGTSVGAVFAVGLTPRDASRAQAPARGITDLVSPVVMAATSAPVLACLGFTI